jgi:uncharacterized membrane protein
MGGQWSRIADRRPRCCTGRAPSWPEAAPCAGLPVRRAARYVSGAMGRGRLEAFSDGVVAILITIMVLELRVPQGIDWSALRPLVPRLLTYALSFVYLAIYWNNHHHVFHLVHNVSGGILWANLHLLFWLSLVPFVTGWMAHLDAWSPPAGSCPDAGTIP